MPLVDKYASAPFAAAQPLWRVAKVLSRLPLLLAARTGDVVWLERDMIAGHDTLERFLPRRTVMDVDDALWAMGRPGYSERIASRCRGVIAGNETIARHYRAHTEKVWLVPTSIDTDLWAPATGPRPPGPWTVGWIGTSVNLQYVRQIEEPLAELLARRPDVHLLFVSDQEPAFTRISRDRWTFERWTAPRERDAVRRMDAGIMPLPDTDWASGKCGAKMLQYMALGIPVVASPVGAGAEILAAADVGLAARNSGEWLESLGRLQDDPQLARRLGAAGRKLAVRSYSVEVQAPRIAKIFAEVLRGEAAASDQS